jgi:predicted Zn-dependent protease
MNRNALLGAAALLVAGFGLGGVAIDTPAEAKTKAPKAIKTATTITAKEKAQGAEAHPQLMQEFGGAFTGPQAAYVTRIGQNIAVQSGMSNATSDFTVTLLNSPVNNAFAIPGGYVYVTRQLMALMNDEAELAGVLGHEVGHVAAMHSKKRQGAATRNVLIGVLATVVGGAIGDNGGLAGAVGGLLQNNALQLAQLATLSFSRDQELQADQLGVRYLTSAGYDPMALSTMLASLAAQTALDARVAGQDARSLPEWASTHPDPAKRVVNAANLAKASGSTSTKRNTDAFMTALDGVLYGDDPKEGVIEGRDFLHPDFKLAFTLPAGFGMQNGTTAVSIGGQAGQGEFSTMSYSGNMDAYVAAVFKRVGGDKEIKYGPINRTTVNGIPAAYSSARVATQSGEVDLTVFVYEFTSTRAFHFVTMAKAGGANVFDPLYASVRRLTDAQAAAIKPREIDVVTVKKGDTIAGLAERMAYNDFKVERFLVLNRLAAGAALTPGQKVKVVLYGKRS